MIPLLLTMPSVKIVDGAPGADDLDRRPRGGAPPRHPVNAPVAEVRRVFTGPKRRVIYLGEVTYRGDFVHMEIDLKS